MATREAQRPGSPAIRVAVALAAILAVAACAGSGGATTGPTTPSSSGPTPSAAVTPTPVPVASAPTATPPLPDARTLLVDTDVAADDLVALSFLLNVPNVTVVAITVSGTGEARCKGGVAVVLSLLERLDAPAIPVACGRATPLAGDHAFPEGWRDWADGGSGLTLTQTTRVADERDAVELIKAIAAGNEGLSVLTTGPLTNLADALIGAPALTDSLGPVYVMGGAVHVPGNLVGPDAPTGNDAAEWNIYVDPHAAQVVVDAGLDLSFVSLDGTNQVPVTPEFAQRATKAAMRPAGKVLVDLFNANPFMTSGSYFLWDPLAAELAAGYAVGTFTDASIKVEEAEGAESGFTRPTSGEPNVEFLSTADPAAAEDTLLTGLNAP
jgi:inosine-uridine nucleoside N-ribohydrolase